MIPARQKSAKEIAEERDREHERLDVYEQRQVDERLRYVFKRLDTKRDDLIDAEEVALMLVQLGCEARAKGGKNTDREAVLEAMPGVPFAGFFAGGEVGPSGLGSRRQDSDEFISKIMRHQFSCVVTVLGAATPSSM